MMQAPALHGLPYQAFAWVRLAGMDPTQPAHALAHPASSQIASVRLVRKDVLAKMLHALHIVRLQLSWVEFASIRFALVVAALIDRASHVVQGQLASLTDSYIHFVTMVLAVMTADASRIVESQHALVEVAPIRFALVAVALIDRASHLVQGQLASLTGSYIHFVKMVLAMLTADASRIGRLRHVLLEAALIRCPLMVLAMTVRASHLAEEHLASSEPASHRFVWVVHAMSSIACYPVQSRHL